MKAVRIHANLLKEIRTKPAEERRQIGQAIADSQRCMGQPHLHQGIGLRKLRSYYYEVRIGLKQRLVFEDTADALVFEMLGDHDDVKRFLKSR